MQTFHDLSVKLDITIAVAGLSDELQRLCRELQKHGIIETAQALKLPLRKVYRDIQTIQNIFSRNFDFPAELTDKNRM